MLPGTNRMFSVEYTGNVGNTNDTANPMSYTDAYKGTMRAVRDIQDKEHRYNPIRYHSGSGKLRRLCDIHRKRKRLYYQVGAK